VEAEADRAERVKYSAYGEKDVVVGGASKRNEKGEIFCLLCKTGKKIPWWNWGEEIERSVLRA